MTQCEEQTNMDAQKHPQQSYFLTTMIRKGRSESDPLGVFPHLDMIFQA